MTERIELVVLPSIAGHAHTLSDDGQPTCGCVPSARAFYLLCHCVLCVKSRRVFTPPALVFNPTIPDHPTVARLQLSSPRCERVAFSSWCDVGSDVPGGGAA